MEIDESTTVANVPIVPGITGGTMPCGAPFFKADDDMFFNLHLRKRKHKGWFDKFYQNTDVSNWCRRNKNQHFYLQYNDMFRMIKAS